MKYFTKLRLNNRLLTTIFVIILSIFSTIQISAQTCVGGLPGSFNPVGGSSNEKCPGAADGSYTLAGFDLFCAGGTPAYPYNYDLFVNGALVGSGTVAACFNLGAGPAPVGMSNIPNLSDGDVITIITCSADGLRGSNSLATIGNDGSTLPNPADVLPKPTVYLCGGDVVILNGNEDLIGQDAWNAGMSYEWNLNGASLIPTVTGLLGGAVSPASLMVSTVGVYSLVISNGCTDTSNIVSVLATTITATSVSIPPACQGVDDGSVTVTPAGGTSYTYLWDNGQTTPINNAAGCEVDVIVTITEVASQCTITNTTTMTCPPTAHTVTVAVDFHESCPGANDGQATATVNDGGLQPDYTFDWSTGGNTNIGLISVENGIGAGAHFVTVTHPISGCIQIETLIITVSPAITITPSVVAHESCPGINDGSATVTVTGGNGNPTYIWSTGGTDQIATGLSGSALPGTIYTVTVNPGACQAVGPTAGVTVSPSLTITPAVVDPLCPGEMGSISLAVTGGSGNYTFLWDNPAAVGNPANTVTGLPTGTPYTVTVTDVISTCTSVTTTTVTDPAALTITAPVVTDETCPGTNDGELAITVTGGGGLGTYTYIWDAAAGGQTTPTATGLSGGLSGGAGLPYSVTINAATNCPEVRTGIVNVGAGITVTLPKTDESCSGLADGSITVTANGGGGGYTYVWSAGDAFGQTTPAIGLSPTIYTVTVTSNPQGCVAEQTTTIDPASSITPTLSIVSHETCPGSSNGSISATAVPGVTTDYTYLWSTTPAQTSAIATGLAGGLVGGAGITYTVTITDNTPSACSVTDQAIVTVSPANVTATAVIDQHESCETALDGQATASDAGTGTGPFTYSWSTIPVQTTPTATGLSGGVAGGAGITYTVTVFDGNGCPDTDQVIITVSPSITITPTTNQHESCPASSDGEATVGVSGGNGNAPTYSWSTTPAQATQTATGLVGSPIPGTEYFVTVNAGVCQRVGSTFITVTDAITVTASSQDPTCPPPFAGDGAITVTATGGTPPNYTYQWSPAPPNGQTSGTITGLSGDITYIVTVSSLGCTTVTNVNTTITNPLAVTVSTTITDPTCFGVADGTATAIPTGGTPPYEFLWDNGQVTQTATGLSGSITGSVYVVTVNGSSACAITATATITSAPTITVSVGTTDETCPGAGDGTGLGATVGSAGPYTYDWSTAFTGNPVTGLAVGPHAVTATDDITGCVDITSFTITPAVAMIVSTNVDSHESCPGENNGQITATTIGGLMPYSYAWSPAPAQGQTTPTVTGLSGTIGGTIYTVTVSDVNLCTVTDNASSITVTQQVVALPIVLQHETCGGDSDGQATVTGVGGFIAIDYGYTWSTIPVQNTATTLANLAPGPYTVTLTDDNGCTGLGSITITSVTPVSVTAVSTNETCPADDDGTATATGSGGTAPYTFSWNLGTPLTASPISTSSNIAGSVAGTQIIVTMTDVNNCSVIATTTVTEPTPILVTITNIPPTCVGFSDGTASVTVTGGTVGTGYSYQWSPALVSAGATTTMATMTGLPTGTYTVTIFDGNLCTTVTSTVLTTPQAFTITTDSTVVTCFGDNNGTASITVTAGGTAPYDFEWSSTSPLQTIGVMNDTENNLPIGFVTASITDVVGCLQIETIEITGPQLLTITNPLVTPVTCNGMSDGEISLTTTGGTTNYTFLWSNGATTENLTGVVAGIYTFTVSDAAVPNPCTNSQSFTISEPLPITAQTSVTDNTCGAMPPVGTATVFNIVGNGGTFGIVWSDPANQTTATATALPGLNYTVTITDNATADNCTSTFTASPVDIGGSTIIVDNVVDETCVNDGTGSIQISSNCLTAPCDFTWNTAPIIGSTNASQTGLNAGIYNVTMVDGSGCTDIQNITVDAGISITANPTVVNIACGSGNTGSIVFSPNGGTLPHTYVWGGTEAGNTTQSATGLVAGVYTTTITEAGLNCGNTQSITITEPSSMTVTNVPQDATCGVNNGEIQVTVAGGTVGTGYSYEWSNNTTLEDATLLAGGFTYTLTITDGTGVCTTITAAFVDNVGAETVSMNPDTVSCFNDADGQLTAGVAFCNNPPCTYAWDNGITQITSTVTGLAVGEYTVTVNNAVGCPTTATDSVRNVPEIVANETITHVLCNGDLTGVIATAPTGGNTTNYTYLWSTLTVTPTITGLANGTYDLTITDQSPNNCNNTFSFDVTSTPALTVTAVVTNMSCGGNIDGAINITVTGGTTNYSYLWSNGAVTEDITGLIAGNYGNTITDGNGCTDIATYTITSPSAITITPTITNVNCLGTSDGTALAVGSGGAGAPYTYLWDANANNQNTDLAIGLSAGTYTVSVFDATTVTSCSSTLQVTITEPATALNINVVPTDASCFGGTNGSITVTATGGNTNYTYTWANPIATATTSAIADLSPNTYTVTVTDGTGVCTETQTITISSPSAITLTSAMTGSACTQANGSIVITPAGGSSTTFAYVWDNGVTSITATATGLSENITYNVTATNGDGCTATASQFVDAIDGPTVTVVSVSATSCFGGNNGAANISVTAGTSPYTYVWNAPPGGSGQNVQDPSGLSAQVYSVVVNDAANCPSLQDITITEPTIIDATFTEVKSACGNNDGSLTAVTTGGTGAYDYAWSNGNTTNNPTNLFAGIYDVSISDANGCSQLFSAMLNNNAGPSSYTINVSSPSCFGASDGSASIAPVGGTMPYSYTWLPTGQTTQTATGLVVGNYIVEVTDDLGCKLIVDTAIVNPAEILTTYSAQPTTCGATDGSITVNTTGGVAPYTYLWSQAGTTTTITGLAQGNYNLTVSDFTGCTNTFAYGVNGSDAPNISLTPVDVTCFGASTGSIGSLVSAGASPYSYQWKNADLSDIVGATNTTLNNFPKGTYALQITDAAAPNCIATQFATINEASEILFANPSITNLACNGNNIGAATVHPIGGTLPYATYAWSANANGQTSATITGLGVGTYQLTLTDGNGCTATESLDVISPAVMVIDTNSNTVICSLGSLDIDVVGGSSPYTYAWSNFDTTEDIANLNTGTYTVTVTDNNTCSDTKSFDILGPQIVVDNITQVSCFGGNNGAIDISVIGSGTPFVYNWTPAVSGIVSNLEDQTNLAAAVYQVSVTDAGGCAGVQSITVTQVPLIEITLTNNVVATCGLANGELTATVIGGTTPYNYQWSSTQTTMISTGLFAGLYQVSVSDVNSCSSVSISGVSNTGGPTSASFNVTNVACSGGTDGTATVIPVGGTTPYTYVWVPSGATAATANNLTAGQHIVEISDANNCKLIVDTTIVEPNVILNNPTVIPTSCGGTDGSIIVSTTGGVSPYTYVWSGLVATSTNTTSSVTGLSQGNYIVTVTDAATCSETFVYSINGSTAPIVNITATDVLCNGGNTGTATAIATSGTPPYTYLWKDASLNAIGQTNALANNLAAGTYYVEVTDIANPQCMSTASVVIGEPNVLQTGSQFSQNTGCFSGVDGSVGVLPIGGTQPYSYVWDANTGGQVTSPATGLSPNEYFVTILDVNNCMNTDSVTIIAPSAIVIDTLAANTVVCSGGATGAFDITVTGGVAPFTYAWSNFETTEDISGLNPDTYTISVTDVNLCTEVKTYTILGPTLTVDNMTEVSCYGGNNGAIDISVTGSGTPFVYNWTPAVSGIISNVEDQTNLAAGVYQISVSDIGGCAALELITVTEVPLIEITLTNNVVATCGLANGELTATVIGGTTPYNYLWSSAQTTIISTGLFAGLYQVSVSDVNSCSSVSISGVSNTGGPTSASFNVTNVACSGGTEGTATVIPEGGTTPYTYVWVPSGAIAATANNLSAGQHIVEIADANNCKLIVDTTIVEPNGILNNPSVIPTSCGGTDGTIMVSTTGGVSPYTYVWSGLVATSTNTTSTVTGLPQGNYLVTVTDASACSKTFVYSINGSTAPIVNITATDVLCNGENTGTATAIATSGTPPYTYLWKDINLNAISQTNALANNLAAGTYYVEVTDIANPQCMSTASVVIGEPNVLQTGSQSGGSTACFNTTDGTAGLLPIGGTLPYTYLWDANANTQTVSPATGLSPSTYYVTVSDGNSCSQIDSVAVTSPSAIVVDTLDANTELCAGLAGGLINVTVTGGFSPYTYSWSNLETTEDLVGLNPGLYTITVFDAMNCEVTEAWSVGGPVFNSVAITAAKCVGSADGVIDITMSGAGTPFTYLWNPDGVNTEDMTGEAGTYSVLVTDIAGCSYYNDTLKIGAADTLLANFNITEATCGTVPCNGSATATITGGVAPYGFVWGSGDTSPTASGMCAGVHTLQITDANACIEVFTMGLSNIGGPDSVDVSHTNVTCNAAATGTATLDNVYGGTTPYVYDWTPNPQNGDGTTNASGMTAGTWFVNVTDANNCILVEQVNITEPIPVDGNGTVVPTSCGTSNGSLTMNPVGGNGSPYTYNWSNGITTASNPNLENGQYIVTVSDSQNCTKVFAYNVNPSTVFTTITNAFDVKCNGGNDGIVILNVAGGIPPYAYAWDDATNQSGVSTTGNGISATNLPAGLVNVSVTYQENGITCLITKTATVEEPDALQKASLTSFDISCNGLTDGSALINYLGGTVPYTYDWGTQTGANPTNLGTGQYTVTITDANNCEATETITITEPNEIVILTGSIRASTCASESSGDINMITTGGTPTYTYAWTGPNNYTNNIEDITGLKSGEYCLTVSDVRNCTSNICVNVSDSITISLFPMADTSICSNSDTLLLYGTGLVAPVGTQLSYAWLHTTDTISNGSTASVSPSAVGTVQYTLVGYFQSCFVDTTITITINDLPDVDAGADFSMLQNQEKPIGGSPTSLLGVSYDWNNETTLMNDSLVANPLYTPTAEGSFLLFVEVTDVNGCVAKDSVLIDVVPVVDVISGFTPNGDGVNDEWLIPYLDRYPDADIQIYNRWGELLYSQFGGYKTPWDGTFDGKALPIGTYYYVVSLNHPDVPEPLTGPITIIR